MSVINQIWIKRSCPCCGSLKTNMDPEVRANLPAENLSLTELKQSFIGIKYEQIFFSYFRCPNCDLLYCPYYFTASQINDLYSSMPDNSMGEDKQTVSKVGIQHAKRIIKNLENVSNYLEIGPDLGFVSKEIIAVKGVNFTCVVEPNKNVYSVLKKNIQKSPVHQIVSNLNEIPKVDFDLAVGIHVLDHLLSPGNDLKLVFERLNHNKQVAFVVHNEKSLLRFLLNKKWPPFCLQHPQLYNRKTMSAILQKNGFEKIKIVKSLNYYHINNLAKMLAQITNLPPASVKIVPSFRIPLHLGNILVTAVKS